MNASVSADVPTTLSADETRHSYPVGSLVSHEDRSGSEGRSHGEAPFNWWREAAGRSSDHAKVGLAQGFESVTLSANPDSSDESERAMRFKRLGSQAKPLVPRDTPSEVQ